MKVRRSEDNGFVIFALSGRIEANDVAELQRVLEAEDVPITLDLEEVRLVDRETVRFLAACEARGNTLRTCPPYIRQWIETGSDRKP